MKRLARAKRRDANEKQIVDALEAVGCTVYRLDEPCDLLVGARFKPWAGDTYLLEVKDGRKPPSARRLTEDESEAIRGWCGDNFAVVRCVEEALCIVGKLHPRDASPGHDWDEVTGCFACGEEDDPHWFTVKRESEIAQHKEGKR